MIISNIQNMTEMTDERIVTVFGSGDPVEGSEAYTLARIVGCILAEQGYGLANGGYGGAMEASARGVKETGGKTIGVTCSLWKSKPNQYIDRVEQTSELPRRLEVLINLGESGFVALPGATGTLLELAMVWELTVKRFLPPRPIVCVGGFWKPLIEMMGKERPGIEKPVTVIDSPEQLRDVFQKTAPLA